MRLKLFRLATLLLLLAITLPTLAQKNYLTPYYNGNYRIDSEADYELFRQLVASGNPYANAYLTADIEVSSPIGGGDEQFYYRGIFDGQGFTITLKNPRSNDYANGFPASYALFEHTKPGCVIRNLRLTGAVSSDKEYAAPLVYDAKGTRFENIVSEVRIVGAAKVKSGMVGISSGVCFFENCAFIGYLGESETVAGFVGNNTQNVSLKSCYSAPTYKESQNGNGNVFAVMTSPDTDLNNYYCATRSHATGLSTTDLKGTAVTMDEIRNGTLCESLNANGKKGDVWVQNGDFPYPFGNPDGTPSNLEPLQEYSVEDNGNIVIDNIIYTLDNSQKTATVAGIKVLAKGVQIPETVSFMLGDAVVTYKVNAIAEKAFEENNTVEYCYIPKTVASIGSYAFRKCMNLQSLHIADADDDMYEKNDALYIGKEPFDLVPLSHQVYFGRNLSWDSEAKPFVREVYIGDIWWGPNVSLIGNNFNEDKNGEYPFKFTSNSVTNGKVFIMGNGTKDLKMKSSTDNNTPFCYLNRNLSEDSQANLHCEKIAFGSFVQSIPDNTFAYIDDKNTILKSVDFSGAAELRSIGQKAFYHCEALEGRIDFSKNENLATIHSLAFYGCKNITAVIIPPSVIEILGYAFANCEKLSEVSFMDDDKNDDEIIRWPIFLRDHQFAGSNNIWNCYIGRELICYDEDNNRTDAFKPSTECNWTFGPKISKIDASLFSQSSYEMMYFEPAETPLICDDALSFKVKSLYIDRELVNNSGGHSISFIQKSKNDALNNVNFGANMYEIPAEMFMGCTALKSLIIPSDVWIINEKAFYGCTGLEIASILGPASIHASAFEGCSKLKSLFMTSDDVWLGKDAFKGAPLEEIYTVFTEAPIKDSEPDAFDSNTYSRAKLQCAGDPTKILLTEPWSKFAKPENIYTKTLMADNWEIVEDIQWDRAQMPHSFTSGNFELLYLPFDMDSYYFGPDAEIYQLSTYEDRKFDDDQIKTDDRSILNVLFDKVPIDTQALLPLDRTYLIKTKHDEASIGAYSNLYFRKGIRLSLCPEKFEAGFKTSVIDIAINDMELTEEDNAYVCEDGVLKLVNNFHTVKEGSAVLFDKMSDTNQHVINLVNDSEELLTSKFSILFNQYLEGYTTFYNTEHNFLAPEWCDVYVVTSGMDGALTLEKIEERIINKRSAVLLKTNKEISGNIEDYLTYVTHGTSTTQGSHAYSMNILCGTDKDTKASELSASNDFIYVLSCNSEHKNTGFYRLTGDRVLGAGKAFFHPFSVSSSSTNEAKAFLLHQVTNGISIVPKEADALNEIYDVMGRRLQEAGDKGLFIIDNKKVIK